LTERTELFSGETCVTVCIAEGYSVRK
jgi:hypothetical protein